jgi:hypothetical protein
MASAENSQSSVIGRAFTSVEFFGGLLCADESMPSVHSSSLTHDRAKCVTRLSVVDMRRSGLNIASSLSFDSQFSRNGRRGVWPLVGQSVSSGEGNLNGQKILYGRLGGDGIAGFTNICCRLQGDSELGPFCESR